MALEKFIQSGFRMPFYMHLFVEGRTAVARATGWKGTQWLVVIERQLNTVYFYPAIIEQYRDHLAQKIIKRTFQNRLLNALEHADRDLLSYCQSLWYHDYCAENFSTLLPSDI